MKYQILLLTTIIWITIFSCKNENSISEKHDKDVTQSTIQLNKFPNVKKLSELKNTQFIPTLEHNILNDNNLAYCATMLIAWDEVRKKIKLPITISDKHFDMKLMNKSNSFKNVLKSNEYEVSGMVDEDNIKTRAELNKSLPFELKLQGFKNKLNFDGVNVSSFGVNGNDSYEQLQQLKILYFLNDSNFIIKLLPKDKEHEIILFKTSKFFNSIADMTKEIEKLTEIGRIEKENETTMWRYYFSGDDEVVIPKINFNIETNYTTLEGIKFWANEHNYQLVEAWQRTAFLLDESGAEIESEAEIEVAAAALDKKEYKKPKPKKMIFNQPFLILLKRQDTKNPYFGLWVNNAELMIKE
jgi:hypothetical protein